MPFTRLSPLLMMLTLFMVLAGCASKERATLPAPSPQAGISLERALILSHAQQAIGTPYRFGGNTPGGAGLLGVGGNDLSRRRDSCAAHR